jgi:DNA sulfur modification protein DndC
MGQLSLFQQPELAKIAELVAAGGLFVVNHSGGKDSQAMFHVVRRHVPDAQIVVVHAHLPEVEWEGTWEHVQATTLGLPCYATQSTTKTLLQMVEARGMFPSPNQRQCTSDLKRGPIEREIRRILKERGRGERIVVNCMGMRAQESSSRAKLATFKRNKVNSVAGRDWYDWLPIHDLEVDDVFRIIAEAGQEPHWAYAAGMTRLSCCFCIMSSTADLRTAARLNPQLYRRYVELERHIGFTMMMPPKGQEPRYLEQITGIQAAA